MNICRRQAAFINNTQRYLTHTFFRWSSPSRTTTSFRRTAATAAAAAVAPRTSNVQGGYRAGSRSPISFRKSFVEDRATNNSAARFAQTIQSFEDEESTLAPKLQQCIHTRISRTELSSRGVMYDAAVAALVARRSFFLAAKIFKKMLKRAHTPSPATTAKMLIIAHVTTTDSYEMLLEVLTPVFSKAAYDEASLRELLDLMFFLEYTPEVVDHVVKRFFVVHSQGDAYVPSSKLVTKLIEFHNKAQAVDRASYWLKLATSTLSSQPIGRNAAHPYSTLLHSFVDYQNVTFQDVNAILQHMEEAGIWPDTSIFNGLIAIAVRERTFDKVFELYGVLTSISKNASFPQERRILPDAYTFATLFSLLHKFHHQPRATARSRKYAAPSNLIPIRSIYKDMIAAHLSHTSKDGWLLSPVMTESVLTLALRAFLSKRDYAGAFIAARAFKTFRLPPTSEAYEITIKHVIERVRRHRRLTSGAISPHSWEASMLGLKHAEKKDIAADSVSRVLFSYAAENEADGESSSWGFKLTNDTDRILIPSGLELDSTFLERILRRALAAHIQEKGDGGNENVSSQTPSEIMGSDQRISEVQAETGDGEQLPVSEPVISLAKRISEAVLTAKQEMVPDGVDLKLLPTRTTVKSDRRKWRKYARVRPIAPPQVAV